MALRFVTFPVGDRKRSILQESLMFAVHLMIFKKGHWLLRRSLIDVSLAAHGCAFRLNSLEALESGVKGFDASNN
jgi:hypothetical protein